MKVCDFSVAWVGRCNQPVVGSAENNNPFTNDTHEGDYCEKHQGKLCKCGKQATHECGDVIGPMVCGASLCNDCKCNFKGF